MSPAPLKACKWRVHCAACCTSPETRRRIGWPDECPEGFTEDNLPEVPNRPPPAPPPPYLAARLEACGRCDDADCLLKNCKPCTRKRQLNNPVPACPVGRWPA